ITAGPAAIAVALKKSRRLSSSAMGPPIPIYPDDSSGIGHRGAVGSDSGSSGTNLSRFWSILRGLLLILNGLFDSWRDKNVPLAGFLQWKSASGQPAATYIMQYAEWRIGGGKRGNRL